MSRYVLAHGDVAERDRLASFDLVLARMLLLHLPDPAAVCKKLVAAARPGGTMVIHDADFGPVALEDASADEVEGLSAQAKTMQDAGVHLALGPKLGALLTAAGAEPRQSETRPSPGRGGDPAAVITALTLERFRERAISTGTSTTAIDAAIAALHDPKRTFIGPTQWAVRAEVPSQPVNESDATSRGLES